MSEAKVIFNLDGVDLIIQCSTEDKMRDICQRYSTKIGVSINSLIFLYGGNQLNLDLKYKDQANSLDKENKEMKVLVYKNENEGFICPKCGEKIKLNTEKIDDIILSNNNIKDTIIGIKVQLDNIINNKNSSINLINIQLKNINIVLNTINENIKINIEKLNNLLNDNNNNYVRNKNIIKGLLFIKLNEINDNILLFNTGIKEGIEVYLENNRINMIKYGNEWKIYYKFEKDGTYPFEIYFNNDITSMEKFFQESSNIISLDFTNFDTSNVTNMYRMFHGCKRLKEIKGINKFITNKVINMSAMFQLCGELEYLDLSNFDTSNVIDMCAIFNECKKLKEIKGLNKFITNKVVDMYGMFGSCGLLEYLDLSNFDTSNVNNMGCMFD